MGIASDIKTLGEDIVASHDVRVKAIGELVKDTHNMLKGFQTEHKEMADNLKADLAKGEGERLKEFKSMMSSIKKFVADMVEGTAKLMKQIQGEQKNRNKAVADLLKEFDKDHKAMSAQLKESLAKGETDRLEDFKKMINGIQKYVEDVVKETKRLISEIQARQDERNKEVLDLLQEFKTEREEMAANWQALTVTMAKKRGIKPEIEAEVKARPVEEAIEELEEKEVPLEEKVLDFIEGHPEGVRVGEMEESLGVIRMKLGQIAKRLLEEGKVRKEKNIYLPVG